ncbi:LLM class F420-dependent oxidoreductase [Mycolicibacterium fortuitum]|jgi:probable F420-dependent oxidoreductase|uniref:LLM class F420-dependent oxidoreductase n=1 Tax=Mycolicibacterium fortuitum TaxID=1766 RepID=UPI0007EBD7E8|nr:LLM class F420-dependent oxidoreductase [Mycolicibacterium fortuitum]MCA4723245.1 LLM class F420-dependent oxidoreductase [Mycolicibacterium fortuitum]MDG5774307.1 LLM class F420-dependent oxidoreductase [Mycolicibacterium fortuitum]MDG5784120.1 LLM class F420-dependent oxidoreductase [Mycolicibacterium fortuitum]OBB00140.1 LLM class F420-dependent oxidoreductase [Mycolicibacterium fortuitum]UBV20452.1 LLM class F420-dependent oxidoreductase [Mycolicibacterium fortuitum]
MTESLSLKPDLGRYGVWTFGAVQPEQAAEIEKLGYGALWVGGSPAADLAFAEPILEQTEGLQLATGIVNIWTADANAVAESFHRIEAAHPGRFLLGIGVGHPEHTDEYRKPYDALVEYLDTLDAAKVPTSRLVIAALGDKVLKLSAQRSAGAHPYLTTPEHTAHARDVLGETVFLAPEHKVVLTTDGAAARAIGRETVDFYLNLSNYLNNWRRLGFTEDDIAKPGSDKLIDAVVAHGTAEDIAARLKQHVANGADHVAIQVLGGPDKLIPTLTELARPLGLEG